MAAKLLYSPHRPTLNETLKSMYVCKICYIIKITTFCPRSVFTDIISSPYKYWAYQNK